MHEGQSVGEISIGKEFGMVTFGALRNEIQPFNIVLMEILSMYMFLAMTAFSWSTEGRDFLGGGGLSQSR